MLEMLFEIAQSKEKEARRIYAMDGLVASETTDAPMIYSSITDANGFTVVCVYGGKSSSPSKQQLQSRSPPVQTLLQKGLIHLMIFFELF